MKLLEQNNDENLSIKEVFSLNVHLTDHTGTLTNVKLGDDIARKMLKCSVGVREYRKEGIFFSSSIKGR